MIEFHHCIYQYSVLAAMSACKGVLGVPTLVLPLAGCCYLGRLPRHVLVFRCTGYVARHDLLERGELEYGCE